MGKQEHRGAAARPAREGQRRYRWVLTGLAIALGLSALIAIPAVALTERPQFCTSCHEMRPYYDAYAVGAHRNVGCVECHVDGGIPARVTHKVAALQEVYTHFTSSPKFPTATVVVPDSRCLSCHKGLAVTRSGFDHKFHVGQLKCEQCHKNAGHTVTPQALAQAGILSAAGRMQLSTSTTQVASTATDSVASTVSSSSAYAPDTDRITGHKLVKCLDCHVVDSFACSNCHTAPHAPRGECATCHRADPSPKAWQFVHPSSATCSDCHTAKHADRGACAMCHAPGATWTFSHPGSKADCVQCHDKPTTASHADRTRCSSCHQPDVAFASTNRVHKRGDVCLDCHDKPSPKHSTLACATCHKIGVSWTFAHPQRTDCVTCHNQPRAHFGTSCVSCHKVGKEWKAATVDHKLVASRCSSCHTAPASHTGRGSVCATCHKQTGKSWAFTHASGSNCGACHAAPAKHYGTACGSCHTSTTSFKKAKFSHPSVGMNVNSMACTSCHPKGYTTHTCAPCHNGTPGG
jgi:hypothetical protein